jgi:hypothetical protein
MSWDFAVLGKVIRNKGRVIVVVPSVDRRHLFDANNVKTKYHQSIVYVLCRSVLRQMADHCLDGFLQFWVEGIIRKVVGLEVGFHWLIVHHVLSDYPGPVSGGTKLENLFGYAVSGSNYLQMSTLLGAACLILLVLFPLLHWTLCQEHQCPYSLSGGRRRRF